MADSEFDRPTLPELITQIRNDVISRFAQDEVLRRANSEVYARAQAAAINTVYGYIDYIAKNILPDFADEVWLAREANMKRCPRKQPGVAIGFARWDGAADGIELKTGVMLQRDDQVEFTVTDTTISAGGILRVPVVCTVPGKTGNTDDGIALNLVSPVLNLSSKAVADTIQGGTDLESVEEWRARIIARWYYVPQSGADPDYVIWAESVPGIARAWTYRHWAGIGTVGVLCATNDDTNPIPTPSQIQAVYDYILPLAPVAGSDLYVISPTVKTVNFQILLSPSTDDVRAAVVKELNAFMKRDGNPTATLYVSRMNEAISTATGEYSHTMLSPAEDIVLGATELPVSGKFTWTS